jgi:PAS domain-containing protein
MGSRHESGGGGVTKLVLRLARVPDGAPVPPAGVDGVAGVDGHARQLVDLSDGQGGGVAFTPLARWIDAVAGSHDACLVLDAHGQVLSMSPSASELLGAAVSGVVGRRLLDVVEVVDFDFGGAADYAPRIAPVAVLDAGSGLMRSLMRVRVRDGARVTLDTSSAPVHDPAGRTVGSVTFLAAVVG